MDNSYYYAWAAGFFDGEGSFAFSLVGNITKRTIVRIQVGQKEPEALYVFQSLFGGYIYEGKDIYRWSLNKNEQIAAFIEKVLPYLVRKEKEAIFVKQYLKSRVMGRRSALERASEIEVMNEFNIRFRGKNE